jgi:acetyl esterase/lipase
MRISLLILLCFWTAVAFAQETNFPRDTSYTVHSAYKKLYKKYPFIKVVDPHLPEEVAVQEEIVYKSLGQRKLHLDVFYPENENEKYPAVLLIHGGGWRTGDRSLMVPLAQQLTKRGYVAATVEYRLSLEAPYPAAVHDLKAAVRWLRAHAEDFSIDTGKIAAFGTSAGGQLAALLGTTNGMKKLEGEGPYSNYSSAVQAIVDVDGVLAFKHPESEEGTMAGEWLGGSYEEVPENWEEASALTHTDENTPPVLFISSSFPRFHAGKNDMIKILEANNIYSEAHTIPDSPHSFWLMHPWFEPTLEYTVRFLDKIFNQEEGEKIK